MGSSAAAGLGIVGSLFGASQSARAQKRTAKQLLQMAEPYLKEARLALPRLRLLAENYYAPRVGKDSPYLRAGHGENLAALARDNARGLAEIQHAYAGTGNIGRARGERLRLANQLLEATNQENLSYGMAQEAYRETAAAQYREVLSALIDFGKQGLSPGQKSIETQGQASVNFWNAFSTLFGTGGAGADWLTELLGSLFTAKTSTAPAALPKPRSSYEPYKI